VRNCPFSSRTEDKDANYGPFERGEHEMRKMGFERTVKSEPLEIIGNVEEDKESGVK
jgi:hypothetical protein